MDLCDGCVNEDLYQCEDHGDHGFVFAEVSSHPFLRHRGFPVLRPYARHAGVQLLLKKACTRVTECQDKPDWRSRLTTSER